MRSGTAKRRFPQRNTTSWGLLNPACYSSYISLNVLYHTYARRLNPLLKMLVLMYWKLILRFCALFSLLDEIMWDSNPWGRERREKVRRTFEQRAVECDRTGSTRDFSERSERESHALHQDCFQKIGQYGHFKISKTTKFPVIDINLTIQTRFGLKIG